jgi:hypothetical protein
LDEYLRINVSSLVQEIFGRGFSQTPYVSVEPLSKAHVVLMPHHLDVNDLNRLRVDALQSQKRGNLRRALQLWIKVNDISQGQDREALDAIIDLNIQLNRSYFRKNNTVKDREVQKTITTPQDLEKERIRIEQKMEQLKIDREMAKLELKLSKAQAKAQQQIANYDFQQSMVQARLQGYLNALSGEDNIDDVSSTS